MYDRDPVIVMANTPQVHNLVVCTLCSCYPRALLGLPPDWYKTPSYRRRAVRWPRALLEEFGTIIPAEIEIRVHDSNANMRYLVMPVRPDGTEGWSEDQLAAIVTRDCMIGVALPSVTGARA
jgi:thiocyanate hydrolase subunit gamma